MLVGVIGITVILALGVGSGMAVTADSEAPITIDSEYNGTTTSADHVFVVRITLSPSKRALNRSTIDISATEGAFISTSSVETSQSTTDGRQVISRVEDRAMRFEIDRLGTGESATIELRVYPKKLVPEGEPLAIVETTVQYQNNNEIVTQQRTVAPAVSDSEVGIVSTGTVPDAVYAIGGAVAGVLLTGLATGIIWRRKRARLRSIARDLSGAVVSSEARQLVQDLRAQLGESTGEDRDDHGDGGSSSVSSTETESDEDDVHLEISLE
ncbi:hypothetical protein [Halobaculum sp. EA56]|uniref:hypothetical protein n=1 Tax=Halobaculum sp. EA56 TaxID=3421648 RepID=UPI003EBD85DA